MKKKLFISLFIASIVGYTVHAMQHRKPPRTLQPIQPKALMQLSTKLMQRIAGMRVDKDILNYVSYNDFSQFTKGEIVIIEHKDKLYAGVMEFPELTTVNLGNKTIQVPRGNIGKFNNYQPNIYHIYLFNGVTRTLRN